MNLNSVTLQGRLTTDPNTIYTQGAEPMAITKFNLAVNRRKKDEADFISIVAFGKTAEFSEKYHKKGNSIIVKGRIQTGNYTNKDGVKIYTTEVVADEFYFAESKGSEKPKVEGFVEVDKFDDDGMLPF